jgi:hypothetical protein
MKTIQSLLPGVAAIALLCATAAFAADMGHTSSQFQGPKANTGT